MIKQLTLATLFATIALNSNAQCVAEKADMDGARRAFAKYEGTNDRIITRLRTQFEDAQAAYEECRTYEAPAGRARSRSEATALTSLDKTSKKIRNRKILSVALGVAAGAVGTSFPPLGLVMIALAGEQQIGAFHAENKYRREVNVMLRRMD